MVRTNWVCTTHAPCGFINMLSLINEVNMSKIPARRNGTFTEGLIQHPAKTANQMSNGPSGGTPEANRSPHAPRTGKRIAAALCVVGFAVFSLRSPCLLCGRSPEAG